METSSPAILIEYFKGPGGTGNGGSTECEFIVPSTVLIIAAYWKFYQGRCQVISGVSPVQARMAHQYDVAGYSEDEETTGQQPVEKPDP